FEVAVTTTSGVYKDTVAVHPDLPFTINPGLRTVPIDAPVLLHGKEQADYDWMLTTPAGSTADFDDPTAQNPMFTPDLVGKYTVTESTSGATFDLYAGTWIGAITNIGVDGRPDASGCTGCHNASGVAPDNFTTWRQSGHAEIFTDNLNTSTHYSTSCFQCHLVGFNPKADNFGADDGRDYEDFLDSGLLNNPNPMNFATVVSEFRSVGRLANVQCESCHGPQGGSDIHTNSAKRDGERVDVSSAVCASCHGEPKRHARFQQWEESKHGEYELAYEEATVENRGATAGHCGRCHSAQGFIAWTGQDDLTQRIQGASGNATVPELTALGLTMDRVHPQTCVACHDPHAQGKTSGEPNTATVRISGSTPMLPSGYKADSVGRGAVCITCHNTRNGLHNDFAGDPSSFGAPHGAAQGDVLMGENAYFMIPGARSPHSLITDTCATCHMELTPPPPELSYNLAGTNHTFEASTAICAQCHGVFDPAGLKSAVMARIGDLREGLEASVKAAATAAGTIKVTPFDPDTGLGAAAITIDATMNPIAGIVDVIDSGGQIAFVLEFEDPITIAWTDGPMTTTDTFGVQLRNLKDNADATLYGLDGNLVRASWNLLLIQLDGSYGIHNPGFAFDVLNASAAEDLGN
ncbi:MAG: cytochrome c family protein, partial [Candidatus Methylomirabilis sp.]|nr:cytochrome c family protein [Deltaproteobacteria bacterium]